MFTNTVLPPRSGQIDPAIFKVWLRILQRVPNSILWLLRFPAAGEPHLIRTATEWFGKEVASRVIFTDVAPKHVHIHRGRVADLFLDTPECNAHTTAADILWSGTPIVTFPRHMHKMCSRVAASIAFATGFGSEMVVGSEQEYEDRTVEFAMGLKYELVDVVEPVQPAHSQMYYPGSEHQTTQTVTHRLGTGKLMDLRKGLFLTRETSELFDTKRWTRNLEKGYAEAWRRWVTGEEFEEMGKARGQNGCIMVVDEDEVKAER